MIIGSTAIKHWFPDFPREPKDIDIIKNTECNHDLSGKVELLENPILIKYFEGEDYLNPNALLTLKMSHLFWKVNWKKHMWDTQWLLSKGCEFNRQLFDELYSYWLETKPKVRKSNLKMNSKDFFNNVVDSPIPHDDMHLIIRNPPTYLKVLKDGEEVEPDMNKFKKLSFKEKWDLVQEEVMVMAYERYREAYYKHAYIVMLRKFVREHAPMEEALFIITNYKDICKPDFNFIKILDNGIEENKRVA